MQKVSFDGVTGKVAFDEYGDTTNKQLTVYQVKNGAWKAVKSEHLQGLTRPARPRPPMQRTTARGRTPAPSRGVISDTLIGGPAVNELPQQLANGLALGALYGLIAIGYTMVYGIVQLINFAHGEIFMIGGFGALTVYLWLPSGTALCAGPAPHAHRRRPRLGRRRHRPPNASPTGPCAARPGSPP